jgi:D-hexose-6-phosphate mutarotase
MAPQGYRNMLCIEAAQLSRPVHLDPGQDWIGSQSLQLL